MESLQYESNVSVEHREKFEDYVKYFSLSEDDLQKTLLDVGCGKGHFVQYLRAAIGNKSAYGVEKDATKIRPGTDGIFVADGLELPFDDDTFELVISKHYLPLFMDQGDACVYAIRELLRVTKEGGKFIGDVIMPEKYQKWIDTDSVQGKDVSRLRSKLRGFSIFVDELESLQESGFIIQFEDNRRGDSILVIRKPKL